MPLTLSPSLSGTEGTKNFRQIFSDIFPELRPKTRRMCGRPKGRCHDLAWPVALDITRRVFSYTNHTLLPEALETWPVSFFERLLPRHLGIIYQLNREFLDEVSARFPGDHERRRRMSIIDEDQGRRVRMAHLAVVGSRRTNGVAELHSRLMRETIFADYAALWPERFTNVTNGISVRRWLKESTPGSRALLTERLGHSLGERPRGARAAARRRRRRRVPQPLPGPEARQQAAPRRHHPRAGRGRGRRRLALRRAGQTHPRVQAPAPQPAPRRRPLQPDPRQPGRGGRAAHRDLRRQGRARLPAREGGDPPDQQRRARRQRGPRGRRTPQGRVPARLRRVARPEDHAGGGPLRADLDRGLRGLGHGQHEAEPQRRADHRHARRRQHRDSRAGRVRSTCSSSA